MSNSKEGFLAFYPDGSKINDKEKFIDFYSQVYYWENRDICFENTMDEIMKSDCISCDNLIDILRWKLGATKVDRDNLTVSGRYRTIDLSKIKLSDYTGNKRCILNGDIEGFFNKVQYIEGIGPVYAATLLYFYTKGEYPIYDKYADIALEKIKEQEPIWDKLLPDKAISNWKTYTAYVDKLNSVFGDEYVTNRNIDRALWAYGHLFNKTESNNKRGQ